MGQRIECNRQKWHRMISPQAKAHGEINGMITIAIHLTVFLKRQ